MIKQVLEIPMDVISQVFGKAMAIPLVPLMLSLFSRWIIWMTIPLRLMLELYQCMYPPNEVEERTKQQNGKNGHHVVANGKDHSMDKAQAKLWQETAEQDQWWGPNTDMSGLSRFNIVRVRLIAESYLKHTLGLESTWEDSFRLDALPLSGARICDVGCGGGILTEALAKAGATVVGLDMTASAIGIAKRHWNETHDKLDGVTAPEYVCQSLTSYVDEAEGRYDVVVCSEVLEHVKNPQTFATMCCRLVRPGGCVVFTSINRTIYALLVCMTLFEDVLGVMPRWLHRLHMCVKPEEIREVTDKMNFTTIKTEGTLWMPTSLNVSNNGGNIKLIPHWFTGLGYSVIAKRRDY